MSLINIIFIASTVVLAVTCLFKLRTSQANHSKLLEKTEESFEELVSSRGVPIAHLSEEAQLLASQSCATHTSKKGKLISFEESAVLLLRSVDSIVSPFNSAAYKSVPAILTTIGILGTFVGITLGLGSLGGMSNDSSKLVEQAMGLIEGLGTAFLTSIAGMAASFLFMLYLSWAIAAQAKRRNALLLKIQQSSKLISGNDLLHQLVEHQKESKSDLLDFSELTSAIQQLVAKPSAMSATEYQDISSRNSQAVEASLDKLKSALSLELKSLQQDEQLLANTISQNISESLKTELTAPISQELSKITAKVGAIDTLVDKTVTHDQLEESLSRSVTAPTTQKLDEIVTENRQINEAMFSLSNVLESLSKSQASPLTEEQLVSALNRELEQPIGMRLDQSIQASGELNINVTELVETTSKLVSSSLTQAQLSKALQDEVQSPLSTRLDQSIQASGELNINVAELVETTSKLASSSLTQEQLSKALQDEVQNPISTLLDQSNVTAAEIKLGIEELSRSRMEEFEHLVEKMGEEVVEPVTSELSETNKVVSRFADVTDDLTKQVEVSNAEMTKATAELVKFQTDTLGKLDSFAGSLDRSLNEFAENSTKALSEISEEVTGIVKLGNESIEKQTVAFSTIIADSKEMFNEQATTLRSVGDESAKLMSTARQELETGLGDIDSKVSRMSSTVQTELESFRDAYQASLTHYFTEQNRLLDESLNEQKSGLNDVVDNFRGVFEEEYTKRKELLEDLDKQFIQLAEAAERVQSMAKAMGLEKASWASEIQLVQQSIGRQVADLGKAFAESSTQFAAVASQMRPEMDDYFKRANKSVEEYFTVFDATSSRIYGRLDRAVDLMSTVIEEAQHEKAALTDKKGQVA
ncbi:hypothetical protein VIN01S_22250 [Vibrio inusitatus NBRC 102082]|uniref:MotA/TolQ/ExbB proton channel domain-containing protein n=1 Tax=Vibrio inusitatus NBRC 102082 TaxID=1219070 RepID=A0A4Y3HWS3_9VIBR|nr:hypothetical protein [Vibrio inusitatus]GEA51421.1 hypothetical protein VIN01S_22250 [Vibrio inusitatus NBRC 102082]